MNAFICTPKHIVAMTPNKLIDHIKSTGREPTTYQGHLAVLLGQHDYGADLPREGIKKALVGKGVVAYWPEVHFKEST